MLLTGQSPEDFREELFYLLSGAGLPILEMKKENLSLEQVFLKLTTTESSGEESETTEANAFTYASDDTPEGSGLDIKDDPSATADETDQQSGAKSDSGKGEGSR